MKYWIPEQLVKMPIVHWYLCSKQLYDDYQLKPNWEKWVYEHQENKKRVYELIKQNTPLHLTPASV